VQTGSITLSEGTGLTPEFTGGANSLTINYSADPVAARTITASNSVNFGRYLINTTGSGSTAVTSTTGDRAYTADATLLTGPSTISGFTVTGSGTAFNGTNGSGTVTLAKNFGTTTGLQTGTVTLSEGTGLTPEFTGGVNNLAINYTADPVAARTLTASTIDLGRFLAGGTGTGSTTVTSTTGDYLTTANVTLLSGPTTISGFTVTGSGTVFNGTNGSGSVSLSKNFTTGGLLSGSIVLSEGSGLTPEFSGGANSLTINYTADAVVARTLTASSSVNLGRFLTGGTGSGSTTITSTTGDYLTTSNVTLLTGPSTISGFTVTGSGTNFNGTNGSGTVTLASGFGTATGIQTGTVTLSEGTGLTPEFSGGANNLAINYTADPVGARTLTASSSVNLGRFIAGTTGTGSTTVTSTTGDYFSKANATLLSGPSTISGFTVTGSGTVFNGTNGSGTLTLSRNFGTATGLQTGSVTLSEGTGLSAEFAGGVNNLSVGYTADPVAMRTITNGAVTDLGYLHLGSTVNVTSNAFSTTGLNATTTSVQVAGGTGSADSNGIALQLSSATNFNGATSTATDTRTFVGTFSGTATGSISGSFNLGVLTLENSGSGLSGETGYSDVTVGYSANVYTGVGVWNTNGGGTWGTISAPANWLAPGGTPGLDPTYFNTDSATFAGAVTGTGNSALVTIDNDSPSLMAITFNNANNSYTIGQGTGTGILKLNSYTGTATVTDTAGNHQISAPLELDSNTSIEVTQTGDILTISGLISEGSTSSLTKTGSGTLFLDNASNSYSGGTYLNAGVLELYSLGSLGTGNLTFGGGTLLFASGNTADYSSLITPSSSPIKVDTNGQNITFASILGGTGGLIKLGSGTLTLGANNTFTGAVNVQDGTLAFATTAANGTAQPLGEDTGAITLDTATLEYTGTGGTLARDITVASGNTGTIVNSGSGTLDLNGGTLTKTASTLVFGGGSIDVHDLITSDPTDTAFDSDMNVSGGTTTLYTANTYSGATAVYGGGTLRNGVNNALPTNTILTLGSTTGTYANTAGTYDLNGYDQTMAGLTNAGSGAATITNGGGSLSTLTVNDSANYVYGGVIQDGTNAIALVKSGAGTLDLTGTNTYTGGTTVANGTLQVGSGGSLASTGGVVLGSGTNSGTLALGDSSGAVSQTLASLTTGGGTDNHVVGGYASGISTLTVNNSSSNTFDGTLGSGTTGTSTANNLALVASGSAPLILTGNNTYTGGTTVTSGATLFANTTTGSATGTGNVDVQALGTLRGTGTIELGSSSSITIEDGGNLAPGTTPSGTTPQGHLDIVSAVGATLTVNTPTSYTTTAQLTFDLGNGVNGSTGNGSLIAGGTVSLAGSSTYLTIDANGQVVFNNNLIQLNDLVGAPFTSLTQGAYLLIAGVSDSQYLGLSYDPTTGLINSGLSIKSGFTSSSIYYSQSQLFLKNGDIYVDVVPEPSTWAMLIVGLALLLVPVYRARRLTLLARR
jgi:autotransporter-associated beta strand protein